ncbi:nucleotide sugar dehydrogenase [Kitasatospora aureofaciens]|uniref:nucleotide sugar dehydrogenase n=1 Tax=Kitasatospora aureofaciens TaxID=1894 RepID=UPI001C442249|nr:nucleotide sugar dehydrogenase [Kitasatospora aureofaciens]MBV6701292.1 nucleotide sugar dehydrogenase [Kitasatospora aureofaciens]
MDLIASVPPVSAASAAPGYGPTAVLDRARTTEVAVVGIGYAGLPLAVAAAEAGHRTRGLDLNEFLVAQVNIGSPPVDTVTEAQLAAVSGLLDATTDPAFLRDCSVIAVCVPTPVDAHGVPDLGPLLSATRTVRDHLRPDQLVIIESTTYPGTTDGVIRETLEESGLVAGEDFYLAFSPERVDPGNQRFGFHNTPKVVGGLTAECRARAAGFYRKLTEQVHVTRSTREAEAAKILENTYRQVNLALVNEFAQICHRLGVDVWDTIDAAATKPFGFTPFRPGVGVGGHCIPVDPLYLVHRAAQEGLPFRMAEQAQRINDSMPVWVAARVRDLLARHGIAIRGARVLLLGVTYKPDVADVRHSPAESLAAELLGAGVDVVFHDPYVDAFSARGRELRPSRDLPADVATADLTVVVQRHRAYQDELLAGARLLLDPSGPAATAGTSRP